MSQILTKDELEPYAVYKELGPDLKHLVAYKMGDKFYPPHQKFMKYHGFISPFGGQYNVNIINEIQGRRSIGKSNIILVTGPAGDGKSWWSLSFAQLFDPDFKIIDTPAPDPTKDKSQVAFSREHILHLIGNQTPLRRGQVIVIDEAQYATSGRRWYEELQKDLMEAIESVRSRGFIILIVALHRSLLDKILRNYVLNFQFHVEEWGEATCYKIHLPRFEDNVRFYRKGVVELPMPGDPSCQSNSCLTCNYCWGSNNSRMRGDNPDHERCMNLRATYERRKREFVGSMSERARKRAEERRKKEESKGYTMKEYKSCAWKHKDEIGLTQKGEYSRYNLKFLIERELGVSLTRRPLDEIRKWLKWEAKRIKRGGVTD